MEFFKTKYGYFDEHGNYVITNVRTPAPWVHVLTNGRYGAVYSQVGSGYSFYIDASESMLTRWVQDLVRDDYGKYFYVLDEETGEVYSVTFQPVRRDGDYRAIYSPGKASFLTTFEKFSSRTDVLVSVDYDVEIVKIVLKNNTPRALSLSIFSYFELNMGTFSDTHREFHRLFFETSFFENGIINKKHMWTAGKKPWNNSYPFILFHSTNREVTSFETDKARFLGLYNDLKNPQAVVQGRCLGTSGRNIDGVNALHVRLKLMPFSEETVNFFIGVSRDEEESKELIEKFRDVEFVEEMIGKTSRHWEEFLGRFEVNVPDKDLELLLNRWLPYQAIAGRLMGRTAYYQIGGAYGFRDQLQDSLAALWLEPSLTRAQILLHASHQREDGSVHHWWTPLSGRTPGERWSDDLLWLPFVVCEYIEHTGDKGILEEMVPFVDGGLATLKEHCFRSLRSTLSNRSERGIPLILHGDWNDALNGLGQRGKGESFWVSEFLYHVLGKVADLFELSEEERKWIESSKRDLKSAFEKYAWNGEWFNRATDDDGSIVGGKEDDRVFLNAQTWAAISKIADEDKVSKAMDVVRKRLLTDYGPLLLHPPFLEVDENVGYITRYAPGTRENGGVYTHAATWTIWAAWELKDRDLAERVYNGLSPVLRSFRNPDAYVAEPYVTPGNSNGPYSREEGRAAWTWYTGSAAWFYKVLIECFLGLKPTKHGLLFSPCNRRRWNRAVFEFRIREGFYKFVINNPEGKELPDFSEIRLNGERLPGNLIPYVQGENLVEIVY
ncbi:MAG: hypothetical protein QXI45_02260 [Thermofilaceae archaeon]